MLWMSKMSGVILLPFLVNHLFRTKYVFNRYRICKQYNNNNILFMHYKALDTYRTNHSQKVSSLQNILNNTVNMFVVCIMATKNQINNPKTS